MDEKKCKSRDEWKKIINNLSASDFQNLVYDLLKMLDFTKIKQRGGGSDGGRDLEATYVYSRPNGEKQEVKCWLQCKKQNKGVSFGQIHEDIARASNQKIDEYYIFSNFDTTPVCKDEIDKGKGTWFCRIVDWSGLKFQDILFSNKSICNYYFPDEEVPPVVDIKTPKTMIDLSSELGKRLGLKLEFKINKQVNLNNPSDVADLLKDAILDLNNVDVNLLALIYQKISMFFFDIEKSEDAIMFLNKSLDITPKNIETLLNKGYISEKIDDVEESNKCYDEILEIDSNNKFALNNKAHNLNREGNFIEALKLSNKALDIDPNFIVAIMTKVEALNGLKKSKEALAFLDEKGTLAQKSVYLQNKKVDLYINILDLKEAYRINEDILKKEPSNIEAINSKGVIFDRNSKFQKPEKYLALALEWFEKVNQQDSKYPLGWSNKVVVYINSGRKDEAEKIIDIAYTLFPRNANVINKKGVVLLCRGKPKRALKYFDKALRLWYREEFLLNKAKAHLKLRHWKEAKEDAEKLLKYNPKNPEAWGVKGEALRHLRQPGAKRCFANAEKFEENPISLLE